MEELAPNQEFLYNWAMAWTAMREYPVQAENGHLAILRSSSNQWEFLSHNPSLDYVENQAKVVLQSPGRRLAIVTEDDQVDRYRTAITTSGLNISAQEAMMTVDLEVKNGHAVLTTAGFDIDVAFKDGFTIVKVTSEGQLAASGQAGIRQGVAVFDKIVTEPQWRRRGLGSLVMKRLIEDLVSRGAKQGLLIASAEGELLYQRLGWTKEHHVLVAEAAAEAKA